MLSNGMDGGLAGEAEANDVRTRVLDAASRLIAEGGLAALTTRAVASAAAIQAPTLYRLFGEKRGLLNAVAEHGLAAFIERKTAAPAHPDPVRNLADAWDDYVAFGLTHPAVFAIMNEVGAPASGSPAMLAGLIILRERVERVARAGRLRAPVDRAVALIHAAGVGVVTASLSLPEADRDSQLSSMTREAVLAAIVDDPRGPERADLESLAVGLRAHLAAAKGLTPGEHLLLTELLDRLARSRERG